MNDPNDTIFREVGDEEQMTPEHYLAVRSDGLTFLSCVEEAADTIELISNIDRRYRTNLLRRGSPINLMVDDATGKADADKETFLRFVWNYLFLRCVDITTNQSYE